MVACIVAFRWVEPLGGSASLCPREVLRMAGGFARGERFFKIKMRENHRSKALRRPFMMAINAPFSIILKNA